MPKLLYPNGVELHFESEDLEKIIAIMTNAESRYDDSVTPITKDQKTHIKKKTKKRMGIPTTGVRGILYRSRIEAKWAYIFENINFKWEYECEDMEFYIPDFSLTFENFPEHVIVEIKSETEAEMMRNRDLYYHKAKHGLKGRPFLLVGKNIHIGSDKAFGFVFYNDDWHRAFIVSINDREYGIKLLSEKTGVFNKIFGTYGFDDNDNNISNTDLTSLWTRAVNESQWKADN